VVGEAVVAPAPVEIDAEPTPEAVDNDVGLSSLSVAQAKSIIEGCNDPGLLQQWFADDSRKMVKRAIEERLSVLESIQDPEG
jgi:hypothetical protein